MSVASRTVAAAAVTAATATALFVAPTGASAASSCTAWATLPSRVVLHQKPVTVHMTLKGTAGCDTGGVDSGATADLRGPGARDPQRWARFGRTDTQTFQLRVDRLGTYTLENAHVHVYDDQDVLVPVHWRRTSVVVTRA